MNKLESFPESSHSNWLFWLPSVTFLLHTLEELPEFPIWASKHFNSMSVVEFATIHVPLIWLVLWVSYRAASPGSNSVWRFWAYVAQWQFAFNAVFHLGASAAFGDYSPGMVTSATVALPATLFMTVTCRRLGLLPQGKAVLACGVAGLLAIAAVAYLFL